MWKDTDFWQMSDIDILQQQQKISLKRDSLESPVATFGAVELLARQNKLAK